jgi:Core-2/I-Branching enzyme
VHSIFHRREIQKRIHAQWGTHELAEAMRNLMQEALEDPLTERLILLSESGIPLYPPHVIYQQLMSESLSRINACPSVRPYRP